MRPYCTWNFPEVSMRPDVQFPEEFLDRLDHKIAVAVDRDVGVPGIAGRA